MPSEQLPATLPVDFLWVSGVWPKTDKHLYVLASSWASQASCCALQDKILFSNVPSFLQTFHVFVCVYVMGWGGDHVFTSLWPLYERCLSFEINSIPHPLTSKCKYPLLRPPNSLKEFSHLCPPPRWIQESFTVVTRALWIFNERRYHAKERKCAENMIRGSGEGNHWWRAKKKGWGGKQRSRNKRVVLKVKGGFIFLMFGLLKGKTFFYFLTKPSRDCVPHCSQHAAQHEGFLLKKGLKGILCHVYCHVW